VENTQLHADLRQTKHDKQKVEDDLSQAKNLMQHRQSDFDTEKTRYEGKLTTANVNNDKLDARLKLEIQTRKDKEFIYKDNQQKNDIALLSLKKTIKGL